MNDLPAEKHHLDCDFRNSTAAKEAAEIFGVDVEENSEVFACNLNCEGTSMKTYRVNTYQTVIVPVMVEAENEGDAKQRVLDGEGTDLAPRDFELDDNNDVSTWHVEEVTS